MKKKDTLRLLLREYIKEKTVPGITSVLEQAEKEVLREFKEKLKNIFREGLEDEICRYLQKKNLPGNNAPAAGSKKRRKDARTRAHRPETGAKKDKPRGAVPGLHEEPKNTPPQGGKTPDYLPSQEKSYGYGIYLYCITSAGTEEWLRSVDACGVDGSKEILPIAYRSLCAVTGKVSLQEFNDEALEQRLQDTSWLRTAVVAHENIIEKVLARNQVVPMKFCTIFSDETKVRALLEENHEDFTGILSFLEGKEEWGLKIYYDPSTLKPLVENQNPKVKQAKADIAEKPDGAAYFLKKKIDHLIDQETKARAFNIAAECHAILSGLAERTRENRLLDKDITGRNEEMILNCAYLIVSGRVAEFKKEVAAWEQKYRPGGLEFSLTGQWPPYNFCSLAKGKD